MFVCIRFVNGIADIASLCTHIISHRAKSTTPLTIAELQNFLNNLVIDSLHLDRADSAQDDNHGDGNCVIGNGKFPRNSGGSNSTDNGGKRPRPDEQDNVEQDKDNDSATVGVLTQWIRGGGWFNSTKHELIYIARSLRA
jgi:hypothetical protein